MSNMSSCRRAAYRIKRFVLEQSARRLRKHYLSPKDVSYVYSIPCMPDGAKGSVATKAVFLRLVEAWAPAIFCDIGANMGEVSAQMKTLLPHCEVHGFEANSNIHALQADAMRRDGVQWHNMAVTRETGEVELFVPKTLSRKFRKGKVVAARIKEARTTGKSSLLRRDESATYDVLKIPGITLDGFFGGRLSTARFALWIDVEGAALMVLQGAEAVLRKTAVAHIEVEGFAFWENQTRAAGVIDRMIELGFTPLLRDREYDDAQFNIIFVRLDAFPADLIRRVVGEVERKVLPGGSARAIRRNRERFPKISDMPIFVPCFNNLTFTKGMLEHLKTVGFENITLVDNASTDKGMRDWLEEASSRCNVERLRENLGPQDSIFTDERLATLPRWFCVSDPDTRLNPLLPADFLEELAALAEEWCIGKAGCALDIMSRSRFRTNEFLIRNREYKIWEWEEQFWSRPVALTRTNDRVFRAKVDTTFALYDRVFFHKTHFMDALRVSGRYTARHLPWEASLDVPESERVTYAASQRFSYYSM